MTYKTVDVIISMEGDFPNVLEVIDAETLDYSLERQKHWSKVYRDVHLFMGVSLNINKNN